VESVKIKVLIADDHLLLRQGLRRLLEAEADIEVVGEAANGLAVQSLARETKPDVILMDVNMPTADGLTAARRILEEAPNSRIIMLTMLHQDDSVFEAVRAGAQGYLLKDTPIEDVVRAIRAVHEGKSLIDPAMASRLLIEFRRLSSKAEPVQGLGNLSSKEVDILRLLATGLTNKEIGAKLFLSEKTVKNHLTLIFQKLQLSDRVQAAIFAVQQGLVPNP
jgi:DNA-binding NarL/FixJ family response regulator